MLQTLSASPKVSTDTFHEDLVVMVEQATQDVVSHFKEVKSKSQSKKHWMQKGSQKYLSLAKEKDCLPDEIIISSNTLRQRASEG